MNDSRYAYSCCYASSKVDEKTMIDTRNKGRSKTMQSAQTINYSKLFSQLIGKNGQMDNTIASFLYYMFPRELFVTALSLLESSNMFVYVLDVQTDKKSVTSSISISTDIDKSFESSVGETKRSATVVKGATPAVISKSDTETCTTDLLINTIYENESELLYRLIVKSDNDQKPPICVDLHNWFCSCDDYTALFLEEISKNSLDKCDHSTSLIKEIDDLQDFSDDKFAQLDAHSLSKQRYMHHEKVMCAHLLAYSMLLRSSARTLRYFTADKAEVLLIPINSMDEWLKLHINIVA